MNFATSDTIVTHFNLIFYFQRTNCLQSDLESDEDEQHGLSTTSSTYTMNHPDKSEKNVSLIDHESATDTELNVRIIS